MSDLLRIRLPIVEIAAVLLGWTGLWAKIARRARLHSQAGAACGNARKVLRKSEADARGWTQMHRACRGNAAADPRTVELAAVEHAGHRPVRVHRRTSASDLRFSSCFAANRAAHAV